MSNFVYDNTPLNSTKVNRKPLPFGEDPNKWVQAVEDWNPAMEASLDLRGGVIDNRFFGLQQQATEPPVPTGAAPDFLWLDNAGILWAKINGISTNLLAGGGGGSLQDAANIGSQIDANVSGLVTLLYNDAPSAVGTADASSCFLFIQNSFPATVGDQIKYSPSIILAGKVWNTGFNISSDAWWTIQVSGTPGNPPTNDLVFGSIPVFGGLFVESIRFIDDGLIRVAGDASAQIDLRGGASAGQTLVHDGTSFVPTASGGDLQTAYDGGRTILIAGFAPVELQINGILTGNVNPGLLLNDTDTGATNNDSPAVMFHCYEDSEGGPLDVYYEMHASGLTPGGSEFYIQVSDDTGGPWVTVHKWANNGDQTWFGDITFADNSIVVGGLVNNIADLYLYRLHNTSQILSDSLVIQATNPYVANTYELQVRGVCGTGGNGFSNGLEVSTGFTQTTNATATTLYTYDLSALDGTVYWLEAHVVGRKVDGTDHAFYIRQVKARREGGTVFLSTIQTPVTDESNAAWDCTFVVSGNNVLLQVTGAAATNIDWSATAMFQFIWHNP